MAESGPPEARLLLVVDDDDDIREVAAAALTLVGGFRVITAGGGAEALTLAARQRPDGILLDVMMPRMTGAQTLAALKADEATRDIPVLLLTASSTTDADTVPMGPAVGVIGKPFDPLTLGADVTHRLGWS